MTLKAPYPWPGGKRKVADVCWRAFGADVPNYVEPCFGSGAMLLGRPGGAGKIETINDINGGVVNFWRAAVYAPDETALWCDWPVSELDLHARHPWLIRRLDEMSEQLRADPKYFDAQVAGWWVWGICQWIGTGWCAEPKNHKRPDLTAGRGVHRLPQQLPRISVTDGVAGACGVHRPPGKLPKLSVTHGSDGVGGVHRLPAIGNDRGINGVAAPPCLEWFRALQVRLRRTRLVCGDWRRVLGPSVLGGGKNVGGRRPTAIFFDPPYDPELRSKRVYADDDPDIARLVREWAVEHGDDPELRIAVCGYLEEHDDEIPNTWTRYRWRGSRGYAGKDNTNRERETIWFSKFCNRIDSQQELFGRTA